jgi:hypothetical protein
MNGSTIFNYRKQLLNMGAASADDLKEIVAWELMTKIAQAEATKVSPKEVRY